MRNIIVTTKIKILIDNDVKLKTYLCFVHCINYSLLLSIHMSRPHSSLKIMKLFCWATGSAEGKNLIHSTRI